MKQLQVQAGELLMAFSVFAAVASQLIDYRGHEEETKGTALADHLNALEGLRCHLDMLGQGCREVAMRIMHEVLLRQGFHATLASAEEVLARQ